MTDPKITVTAEIYEVSVVPEMPNPAYGVYPLHVVREDGWKCIQPDCDGIHHVYVKEA